MTAAELHDICVAEMSAVTISAAYSVLGLPPGQVEEALLAAGFFMSGLVNGERVFTPEDLRSFVRYVPEVGSQRVAVSLDTTDPRNKVAMGGDDWNLYCRDMRASGMDALIENAEIQAQWLNQKRGLS